MKNYELLEARYNKTPNILLEGKNGNIVHLYIHADTLKEELDFEKWIVKLIKEQQ